MTRSCIIVGAGSIGRAIAELLAGTGDYDVTLIDGCGDRLAPLKDAGVATVQAEVRDPETSVPLLRGGFAVMSALPYTLTVTVAKAVALAGVHYLDLTEDVPSTREVRRIAARGGQAFLPQCGLAPGFVSIVANDLAGRLDAVEDLRLRVGALPLSPSNRLKYHLTWSIEGLINEYCEPCEAIVDGERRRLAPLEDVESLVIDGVDYEAFNTSGGLGSLCDSMLGRVRTLNYKTIRYPGHAMAVKSLLARAAAGGDRALLTRSQALGLPTAGEDVVVIAVTATGTVEERRVRTAYVNKLYGGIRHGRSYRAIQLTTASAACAAVDLLASAELPQSGFVRQEDIPLERFLANRFGAYFAMPPSAGDLHSEVAYRPSPVAAMVRDGALTGGGPLRSAARPGEGGPR